MTWTHVVTPNVGLVTNIAPTALPPGAVSAINGCYLKQGKIISDYGYLPFPTPSQTQSNQLIGTVMTIEDFNMTTGIEFLLCFTTQFVYNWNTVTMTWDVVNQGVLIDNADTTWTGESNVTTTADNSIFIRGTNSSKNIISSLFTTGIISYHNFSSLDSSASNLTNISFWVYSTINLTASIISVRLSSQMAGGIGDIYADYPIPAIIANTWTHCTIPLISPIASSSGFVPSDMTALLSVSLIANNNPGALTLYIDDIQVVQCFTGTPDDRFSLDVIYNKLLISNGIDLPSQIVDDSGPSHTTMTLTLPAGSITSSKIIRAFKDHVLFFNNTENGVEVPQRCTWTNIGTTDDLLDGTSGFQDLTDNTDIVVAAEILSENIIIVYKENSLVLCSWVGGQTPFRFDPLVDGYGALSKDSVVFVEGYHIVIDNGNIYVSNGTAEIQPIDAAIQPQLYANLNGLYTKRTFTRFNKVDNEIEFWICYQDSTPDQGYTFNQVDTNWTIKARNISGFGSYQTQVIITIGELIGTIAQQNYEIGSQINKSFSPINLVGTNSGQVFVLNKQAITNGGQTILSMFQTPEFVCPSSPEVSWSGGSDYENMNMRVKRIVFEAMGTSITVQYSIDGGLTFNPCQGGSTNVVNLNSIFTEYELYFETDAKSIMFMFSGGPFSIRYYGFEWAIRSGRR